jgi:hypothetical protein
MMTVLFSRDGLSLGAQSSNFILQRGLKFREDPLLDPALDFFWRRNPSRALHLPVDDESRGGKDFKLRDFLDIRHFLDIGAHIQLSEGVDRPFFDLMAPRTTRA